MIRTDTLTCEILPNAVEGDSLSCSMPPLEHLELWSTVGDVSTAVLTLFLVALATWAGWTAVKTLNQTRQNSIDQTRPYVFAQVVPSIAGAGVYDLVVQNSGQSSARELRISCPQFPETPDRIAAAIHNLFETDHVLPPGTRIRSYWQFSGKGRTWKDGEGDLGMPSIADIHVSYRGPDGEYEDVFPVNLGIYAMGPIGAGGHDVPDGLTLAESDLHKMLGVIATSISNLER